MSFSTFQYVQNCKEYAYKLLRFLFFFPSFSVGTEIKSYLMLSSMINYQCWFDLFNWLVSLCLLSLSQKKKKGLCPLWRVMTDHLKSGHIFLSNVTYWCKFIIYSGFPCCMFHQISQECICTKVDEQMQYCCLI